MSEWTTLEQDMNKWDTEMDVRLRDEFAKIMLNHGLPDFREVLKFHEKYPHKKLLKDII